MKSSIHLLYGIIIGILICACSGLSKKDEKEFTTIQKVGGWGDDHKFVDKKLLELRDEGWTIIDWEVCSRKGHFFLVGR